MSMRGAAAIVGIGEIPTRRTYPGRTTHSLLSEASRLAIRDAGLRKKDIDGLITCGTDISPMDLAEYMGLHVAFSEGVTQYGASGTQSIVIAAVAIQAGLANTVLCVMGGARDPDAPGMGTGSAGGPAPASKTTEFETPFGPAAGANTGYGLMKQRHMHEYGTTDEQFARIAVNQRFNALTNENAVFHGQPISVDDVLESRMVNDPLHLLECVMPCAGASAAIVTSASRAKDLRRRPVYILGAGAGASDHDTIWQAPDITTTPVKAAASKAYEMSGYGPKDVQFAQVYD